MFRPCHAQLKFVAWTREPCGPGHQIYVIQALRNTNRRGSARYPDQVSTWPSTRSRCRLHRESLSFARRVRCAACPACAAARSSSSFRPRGNWPGEHVQDRMQPPSETAKRYAKRCQWLRALPVGSDCFIGRRTQFATNAAGPPRRPAPSRRSDSHVSYEGGLNTSTLLLWLRYT